MFKTLDFSKTGGVYAYQETLDWLQTAYGQVLDALAASYGDKLIISGVTKSGSNYTSGWVVVGGQILPFVGGGTTALVYTETVTTNEQYDDGNQKPFYTIKRLKFTATAVDGSFNFTDLVRLPFATESAGALKDALTNIQTLFKSIINLENCVILSGCIVSSVNTGASTCSISAGTVLINGAIVAAPARVTAQYPCYLKPDGTYVTVEPTGDYITFNYGTSQYYIDVIKRSQHYSGEVIMSTNTDELDFFDAGSGIGKWRWLGWKLCEQLRSRVPLGYDNRTSRPDDEDDAEEWDANYNTVGNAGGENKHTLTTDELPAHNHGVSYHRRGSLTIDGQDMSQNLSGTGASINTGNAGGGSAHENRQPYRVMLFIERL